MTEQQIILRMHCDPHVAFDLTREICTLEHSCLPEAIEPTGMVIRDSEKVIRVIGIGESTMVGGVKTHADGFIGVIYETFSHK